MKRFWITSFAATVAILGLSGCSLLRPLPGAGDTVGLGVIVDGVPLDELLLDQGKTDEILIDLVGEEFATDEGRKSLRKLLEQLETGDATEVDVPDALTGIAGASTAQFARRLLFPGQIRKTGLIGDYLFEKQSKDKEGRVTGRGHLTVDVKTEIFDTIESYRNDKADRTILLQWHIKVLDESFVIHDISDNPDDPFPGTVIFPPSATNPNDPTSIPARGLDHKLFAQGKKIVVRDIFRKIDGNPIERLPNIHPFYKSTEESCIDLLFRGDPPAYRIDFPDQSGYCLGRCAHPQVINTM